MSGIDGYLEVIKEVWSCKDLDGEEIKVNRTAGPGEDLMFNALETKPDSQRVLVMCLVPKEEAIKLAKRILELYDVS